MAAHLLAIDQGTTSTRSIVFDTELNPVATAQQEFRQIYPAPGHVEHDPEEIWSSVLATAKNAMAKAGLAAKDIAGIGITNQRETVIVWDRATGKPLHNAIVWQDRRTAALCKLAQGATTRAPDLGAHRLAARSVFLRNQDRLDPRSCRRRARGGEGGTAGVRHGRHIPAVAADRRPCACDRRHQCRAHLAVRHQQRQMGSGACRIVSRAREYAAGGARLRGRIRHHRRSSAVRSKFSASPATSRRRPSGRAVSRPA